MNIYKCGYSGGFGGQEFNDNNSKEFREAKSISIKHIEVKSGGYIDSIQIVYNIDGNSIKSDKHGGPFGTSNVFDLNDDEYVTGISGRFGGVIDSLQIHTNRRSSPKYGGTFGNADYAYFAPEGSEIIGFFGRSAYLLDGIGVLMKNRN